MADINYQIVDADGHAVVYTAAAAGGDALQLHDNAVLILRNTTAGAITATLVTPGTVGGLAVGDRAIAVPATNGEIHVALDKDLYKSPTTGRCDVTYSAAGLSVAVTVRG